MKKTIVLVFCFQVLAGFELEKQLSIAGKNRIEIEIIPKKKKNKNRNFLIILIKN